MVNEIKCKWRRCSFADHSSHDCLELLFKLQQTLETLDGMVTSSLFRLVIIATYISRHIALDASSVRLAAPRVPIVRLIARGAFTALKHLF